MNAAAKWLIAATSIVSSVVATTTAQSPGQLNVCHAGSLTAAFAQVEKAFAAQQPGVTINDTAGGSIDLIRRLSAGDLQCDVYASADYLNVDLFLKPAGLADYTIVLASGRMVLAYLATDPKGQALPVRGDFKPPASVPEVEAEWYRALLAPGVRVGVAHPFLDPGGYRAHLIFDLAQTYYKLPGLYNAALQHFAIIPADSTNSATTPALGREFNFQITYEHGAATTAQSNPAYRYARLPVAIDLSDPAREDDYAAATVTIPGLGLTELRTVTMPASRAAWGVTVIKNSPNRDNAIAFVGLLLGPTGSAALKAAGPTPMTPATAGRDDYARLPLSLQSLVTVASARR